MPRPTTLALTAVAALVLLAGAGFQAVQAQPPKPDPIVELLAEVRELRLAMERLASAGPRMQLLTSRLAIQEDRVNRATRDLDDTRAEIDNLRVELQALQGQAKAVESALTRETEPRVREDLERQKEAIASRLESLAAREPTLRAREAELLGTIGVEQARWQELSGRLDELERVLEGRR